MIGEVRQDMTIVWRVIREQLTCKWSALLAAVWDQLFLCLQPGCWQLFTWTHTEACSTYTVTLY